MDRIQAQLLLMNVAHEGLPPELTGTSARELVGGSGVWTVSWTSCLLVNKRYSQLRISGNIRTLEEQLRLGLGKESRTTALLNSTVIFPMYFMEKNFLGRCWGPH